MPYAITKEMRLRFATLAPYLSQICRSDNEVVALLALFQFAENNKSKPEYVWALERLELVLENYKISLRIRLEDLRAVNPINHYAVFETCDILESLPGRTQPLVNEQIAETRRQRQRIRPENLPTYYVENPAQRHPAPEIPVQGHLAENNPAQGPLLPENPAQGPLLPENPAQGPLLPANPAQGHLLPENPAQGLMVPENPAQGLMVPENPHQGYLQPENPDQGYLQPENPDQGYLQPENLAQGDLQPNYHAQGYLPPEHPAQGFLPLDNPAIPQHQYFLFPEWFLDMYEYDGAQQ